MSLTYRAVGWNANKRRYDLVAGSGVALYLAVFVSVHAWSQPALTIETLLIRAFGSAALLLLHIVLTIGPLARLDARCLPLLYNRRHLGVLLFTLAATHGVFAIVQFHAFGTRHPVVSALGEPFQGAGVAALGILFVMAATSHDFWLRQLTAPAWKMLHLGVYVAYTLIVVHVAFGVLQEETTGSVAWAVGLGAIVIASLHVLSALRERAGDQQLATAATRDGFVDVCAVDDIPERRAVISCLSGERVAVFRHDRKVSALSNVCQHQNGPLGEGRIVHDCVVCPWHGYEYLPESGASPAPFTEKVPTFSVRVVDGRVLVHPQPHPPGTHVPPARIGIGETEVEEFYVGYEPPMPPAISWAVRRMAAAAVAGATIVGVGLAIGHVQRDGGSFAFGRPEMVTGRIIAHPHPRVLEDRASSARATLLVAAGKHGAAPLVRDLDGRRATFEATRISRDGHEMLEVRAGSPRPTTDGASHPARPSLPGPDSRRVDLLGEIVDTKCYLGVMVPGEGHTHAACASLCLRGGIAAALRVRDADGRVTLYLLESPTGEPLAEVAAPLAGRPVMLSGLTGQRDGWHTLQTSPATWRALAP